ncbi:MAG TPA: dihydrofolate reductase [Candidatus Paceibacterota bacterium]|nr:dihydrofolate reductase [Candidatus Paceibacterota bacterium]
MPKTPPIYIVAAIGTGKQYNGGLGKDGKLLWHIPDDLKRFKQLTSGHPIIMGRKTFDSIVNMLGKPLPGRTNIVVTRDSAWQYEGVMVAHSLEEALEKARELDPKEIHIGGGAEMYKQALPYVNKLFLTLIEDDKEADTFFPAYEKEFTKVTFHEDREHEGLKYKWVDLERE